MMGNLFKANPPAFSQYCAESRKPPPFMAAVRIEHRVAEIKQKLFLQKKYPWQRPARLEAVRAGEIPIMEMDSPLKVKIRV